MGLEFSHIANFVMSKPGRKGWVYCGALTHRTWQIRQHRRSDL